MFEEPRNIATQHATSYEGVMLCQTQGRREVTPSSGEGAPSDIAIHCSRESIKGGKKRHKQRLQGSMTMTDHDDGNNGEAGCSSVRCASTIAHNDKRQARLTMDYFKRLLEADHRLLPR
jgi:hypothetical protein